MKKLALYCACLLLFPLAGCVKEDDPKDCYQILYFSYNGDGTEDIFPEKIDQVNLYIYDQNNTLVQNSLIGKSELSALQGVRLNLPSGKYNVVCWGNAYDNTLISDISSSETGLVSTALNNSGSRRDGVYTTNDSLYYGTKAIDIPMGQQADTVFYKSAHIKMLVLLTGLEDMALPDGSSPVEIQMDHLSPKVDFNFNFLDYNAVYYPVTVLDNETNDFQARFNVLRFNDRNDIMIRLVNKEDGTQIYSVSLASFMEQNDINVDGINESFIGIRFIFNGTSISIAPWDEENIIPGI